jgi:hypothetical protein
MRVAPLRCTPQATKESTMKKLITVLALALAGLTSTAYAADSGCAAKAGEKKLAGAAKNSFMKKCEREAGGGGDACDPTRGERSL